MDSFGPQDPSESLVVPHEAVAGQVVPKQRDFLSFLSLFVSVIREMSTDLHLAGVLLGPAINIQDPISRGKFSYVTLSEQEELANNMLVSPENLQRLPNIVALKSAILDGDENSPSSLRLYSSMATELQILRDRDLFRNENIVTLLGVCWQLDHLGQVLPVFIMEATEIGNLKAFLSSRSPSLEQKVKICIDIVMAIRIIHQKGVIHGDVKPENVLIFQKDDGSFIAKLCDFGSSILISAASSLCSLPGGTRIWQAPEVGDAAGPEELKLADIYSVGLVIWYIFTPNVAMAILDCDPILLQESKVSGDLIATTIDTLEDQSEQPQHIDDEEITQLQQCLVSSMLASPAAERWSNNAALECLREILNTICDRNTLLTPIHSEAECWDAISERNYTISMHKSLTNAQRKDKEPEYLATDQIQELATKKQGLQPEESNLQQILDDRDKDGLFDLLRANASINILPPPVFRQLKSQLQLVSNDNDQEIPRRAEASYQYALAVLGQSQSKRADDEEIEEGLDMLCQAAVFGNQKAQCILSIVHEAFGRSAPFGADIEIPWLVEGTIQGSMTARRRLQLLDCHDYSEAMKTLRCKYGGIGLEVNIDNEELDDYVDMHYISHYSSPRMLQILAYAGRTDDVRGILLLNRYDIDEPDAWGETALLVACRSGHAEIAKLLLRAGANPRIPSMEMLTPLHFLSAFDDDDIPTIARLMNDNKVDIEARSINGRGFNIRVDCQFGKADGTPLLWAVAAGNLVATQTLVELGADPFDISGANVPVSSSWGDNFHLSPVDFAALKHQHIILEVMLNHSRRQSAEICEWHLNNNYRLLAPNPEFATLAMFWAIDYSSESILERLIIHGGTHQEACKKTIQVLIEHGASTAEIDNQGRSALEHASLQGQRFLIRFLLDHGGSEILASSSRLLLQMAHNTVRVHDYSSFDMLIHHAESIGTVFDDDDMEHFCARAAELGDNIFYIDFYLDDKRWNNVSNRNDGELFERAILKGHFGMARQIFEKGHVDLSKRLYPENGHSSATILGRLIARAKRYKNAVEKIEFFLSLVEASDEVFYNVITVFEMELTACHAACLHANFRPGLAASGPVIDAILKHFNQECYLNAQVSGGMCAGYTALHFAISDGNVPAAARLLETVINRNIVNDQGETPLDMVKMRWRNQRQFMAGVPLEERPIRKARHDQITEKLTHLLCRAGAVCRKYSMMVRKLEANTIRVEIFESDISDEATLNSNYIQELNSCFPGLGQICCDLQVDHIVLIGFDKKLLEAESEVVGRQRVQEQGGGSNPVFAGWNSASCLSSPTLSRSTAGIGLSSSGSSGDVPSSTFNPVIMSHPLSRHTTVKVSMDDELADLCDWFRKH